MITEFRNWIKTTQFYQWWINTPLIEQRQAKFKSEQIQWNSSCKNIYKIEPNPKSAFQFNPYYVSLTINDYGAFPSYNEAEKAAVLRMKPISYFDVTDFPSSLRNDVAWFFLGELTGTIYTVGEFDLLDEFLYTQGLTNGQLVAIRL